ncbi:hypothetical protein HZH68_012172 [Vespula germanica]|uniref:Uncharacterized protein n=1 Tax=Vespula germanica TaxID=30212 RepID=A0A834MYS3_VESGE|nr:hypothetical protein HZH68_012172 [Vespula germanica]
MLERADVVYRDCVRVLENAWLARERAGEKEKEDEWFFGRKRMARDEKEKEGRTVSTSPRGTKLNFLGELAAVRGVVAGRGLGEPREERKRERRILG